jgi:hypothetical protein
MRRNVSHLTVFLSFHFAVKLASFEHDNCELIFREKPSTFSYGECSRLEWKQKVLLRYVVYFHFCIKRRTVIFQFNRVFHFNGDNCSGQKVRLVVRLPRSKILRRTVLYCPTNFIFKRECVTEEVARVQTIEVSLCVHSVTAISVYWSYYWSFLLVCFFCFRAPLTSCASLWRADETKNYASPKLKILLQLFASFLDNSHTPVSVLVFVCRSFYDHSADF